MKFSFKDILKRFLPTRPADTNLLIWYFISGKLAIQRALSYAQIPLALFNLINFFMIAELRFNLNISEVLGISTELFYIILILFLPFTLLTLGLIDIYLKIWSHETIYTNDKLSPRMNEMLVKIRDIHEEIINKE